MGLPNCLVDKYTKEELEAKVNESFSMKDLLRNLGYTSVSGRNNVVVQKRLDRNNISTEHWTHKTPIKRNFENVFIENSTADQSTLRRHYLKGNYTEYKCSICNQEPLWNGKELTLTLDHINGKNTDDRLENLRWVCPNCDRQLDTFGSKRGRN